MLPPQLSWAKIGFAGICTLCVFLLALPANGQNLWEFLRGPYGGRATGMAETSAGTLYAATYGSGLQHSTDHGASWTQVNFTSTHHNQVVHLVFVDVNDRILVASAEGQIYASDNGVDFDLISSVVGFPTGLARSPTSGKLVMALHDGSYNYSILDSNDGGETWNTISQNIPMLTGGFFDFHILPGGEMVGANGLNGVVVSTDGGVTFSSRSNGLSMPSTATLEANSNGELYCLTYNNVYRSIDAGLNWTSIKGNLPGSHFAGKLLQTGSKLFFFNAAENTVGGQSVFMSTVGTTTWTKISDNLLCYEGERLNSFAESGGSLFVLSDGKGIWRSINQGVSWSQASEGITATDYHDLVVTAESTLIMGDPGGLSAYDPSTDTWYRRMFESQPGIARSVVLTFDSGFDAVTIHGNKVLRTADGGRTWSSLINPSYFFWHAAKANNKIYAYATRVTDGTRVILRSDNQGDSWILEYFFAGTDSFTMEHFAMDESRNAYVGIIEPNHSISVAKVNLNAKTETVIHTSQFLFDLQEEHGKLFIVRSNGSPPWEVVYSEDQGQSFITVPTPNMIEPPSLRIYADELFALGPFGAIFRTVDNGAHWDNWLNFLDGYFTSTQNLVKTPEGNYFSLVQNKGLFRRLPTVKVSQTISFPSLENREIRLGAFQPVVSATSGLPVTLVSSDENVARVEDSEIIPVAVGSVQITAYQQGSNYWEEATPVERTLNIVKSPQSINFNPLNDVPLLGPKFGLSATATSSLPIVFESSSSLISISNDEVTMLAAGPVSITARQAGNEHYDPAPEVTNIFCINPMPPVLTLVSETENVINSNATETHLWYKDGISIAGVTGNSLEVTEPGTYTARVEVDGCESAQSIPVIFVVTGLGSNKENQFVYPNPVGRNGSLTVSHLENVPGIITILDSHGDPIRRVNAGPGTETILDVDGLGSGLYLISVQQHTTRVVKVVIR